jgi:hypothetical protein
MLINKDQVERNESDGVITVMTVEERSEKIVQIPVEFEDNE